MNEHLEDRQGFQNLLRGLGKLAVIAALLYFVVTFAGLIAVTYGLNARADRLQRETAAIQGQTSDLQERIAFLQTDEGIEEVARERLGWAKPGETSVILTNPLQKSAQPAATPTVLSQPWRWWWQLFFGG